MPIPMPVSVPASSASVPPDSVSAERDPRWAAIVARDPAADGRFFYSVKTTGVYCRPSCASRRANPKNVRFHASAAAAQAAGFRPCKRCRPDEAPLGQRRSALVAAACRGIERAVADGEAVPTLELLAKAAKLSPYHFHRLFKAETGVTPRGYGAAKRAECLRGRLAEAGSVTEAIYEAGYGATSRFYEKAGKLIGMTPGAWRKGGADEDIRYGIGATDLGALLVAMSARGLCAIALGDKPAALERDLRARFPAARLVADKAFARLLAKVAKFVAQPSRGLDLPLDVRGTAFQQRVWQALQAIPPGRTASYAEIAKRVGAPKAVRAVGSACGANAIAVAIPCHRAVRSDGALSNYRWGVARKRALLEREAKKR